MARDYANKKAKKHGRRARAAKQSSFSWKMWFIASLLIMLFAAGLYYLSHIDPSQPIARSVPAQAENKKNSTTTPTKPRFEFYTILSEPDEPSAPVAPAPLPPSIAAPTVPSERFVYQLQVGAFKNPADADRLNAKLSLMGYDVSVSSFTRENSLWYRVRLGPYVSLQAAQRVQKQLQSHNYSSLVHKTHLTG